MILALRTDKPEAELYLLNTTGEQIASHHWQADRQLADTLLKTILAFLEQNKLELKDLTGIIVFTGRGSFTGLRIGTTVANALAYGLGIPVVSADGEDWLTNSASKLDAAQKGSYVIPTYDSEPNITRPKH